VTQSKHAVWHGSSAKPAARNLMKAAWKDEEMAQMANITDADIQAAANSASPKLRDLNTARPDSDDSNEN